MVTDSSNYSEACLMCRMYWRCVLSAGPDGAELPPRRKLSSLVKVRGDDRLR